ncbi:uncharacterized protein M6B38_311255 [Iris pallida]|uniref:CBS domain-containing protein n=1 Tax=Iris pallida TaxID=29817 RepID=A0AAX6HGE9_IRIPA|nr:uncharacterized protein M6B38_311255 [Iris pallida]
MAVSLLSHDVSDLCIGKPPLKSLPASATVAEAICALKSPTTAEAYISIVSGGNKAAAIVGKVCMVDVLCYLCSSEHISSPVAALEKPVSVLLPKDPARGGIRRIDFNSSISEAIDVMIDGGNHSLIVPIRRKREGSYCFLTEEDLLRFFLNSIFLFSSIASLSVASLGLVRAALSVCCREPALSALALIRSALDDRAAVAVVTDDGKLVGEISPSTLSACDETVAAAIAALSAGELMAYIDCCSGGVLMESVVDAVKTRLREKGMLGMIRLIEEETISSLQSSSTSSSSSDEESEAVSKRRRPRRTKSGSYSTRMGRRSEEAIVCHPESSLVAVMVQALAHRVSYVWVVNDEYGLVGVVTFPDLLRLFREEVSKA